MRLRTKFFATDILRLVFSRVVPCIPMRQCIHSMSPLPRLLRNATARSFQGLAMLPKYAKAIPAFGHVHDLFEHGAPSCVVLQVRTLELNHCGALFRSL